MANCKNTTPMADAIIVGLKSVKPAVSVRLAPKFGESIPRKGCVLLMACVGAGIRPGYRRLQEQWPWLSNSVALPCGCEGLHPNRSAVLVIAHLFDSHVMQLRDWNLLQLLAWIRDSEPTQPGTRKRSSGGSDAPEAAYQYFESDEDDSSVHLPASLRPIDRTVSSHKVLGWRTHLRRIQKPSENDSIIAHGFGVRLD